MPLSGLFRGAGLRRLMIGITVIGVLVASYLTYVHYSGSQPLCAASGNPCSTVQKSVWSKLDGVPVALLGLIGYVTILGTLLAPDRDETRLATLGVTLVGTGFSGYLTYRELFSIHAICEWCVSSAIIMTILLILSIVRYIEGAPVSEPEEPEPEPVSVGSGRSRAAAAGRR